MEYIFDCFFNETFTRLERSGLHARNKRKDVIDHLNAVISGCCKGQNLLPEEGSRMAIVSAIRYHQRKKMENSEICMMGKYHNILYIALKICWDWGVKDSATVAALLEEIYSCEKTFERLFLGALFGTTAPHFIAGWKSDFKDQDENARAMVYYLEHATIAGLEFPVCFNVNDEMKMIRFIDIPIESCGKSSPLRVALQASAPDVLIILLRYGANPSPFDGGSSPIIALLDRLIEFENRRYPYQLEACFQILMRTIPFIEMPYKPHLFAIRKEKFQQKYSNLIDDGIIKSNHVFGVTELKHLCRCSIRERLRENCQLPDGIKMLRIPRSLKRYVDLMGE